MAPTPSTATVQPPAIQPPAPLSMTGNITDNWTEWKEEFELYLDLVDLKAAEEPKKFALLKYYIGKEARKTLETFSYTTAQEASKYTTAVTKLNEYYIPKKNVTFERHVFNSRDQLPGESIDAYLAELRRLSDTCEYDTLRDGLIRDRIICGLWDKRLKGRLLEANRNLMEVVDVIRSVEQSESRVRTMEKGPEAAVHAMRQKFSNRNPRAVTTTSHAHGVQDGRKATQDQGYAKQPKSDCKYCGYQHPVKKCPAYGCVCTKCNKRNHYARVCQSSKVNSINTDEPGEIPPEIRQVTQSDDSFRIHTCLEDSKISAQREKREWIEPVTINGHAVSIKLDPGAQGNMMSKKTFSRLQIDECNLTPCGNYVDYSKNRIPVFGRCQLSVECRGQNYKLWFTIVDLDCQDLLGLTACEDLNLVARIHNVNILDEYADVFEGLGCLPGTYKVTVDPTVVPVQEPPRRCPIGLADKFKRKLDKMESQEVIVKETEPTEWVSAYVLVDKPDDDLRVCIDPHHLNKAIVSPSVYMERLEDITARLAGAKWFTVLDAKSGYWNVKLDEASSKLFTFASPYGRYRFKRLPYGAKCSSEIFATALRKVFEGVEGMSLFADDIIIWGRTREEHDARLRQVLQRARDNNLKLNAKKNQIATNSVSYLGHVFSSDGIYMSDQKVKAITEMPEPESRKDLERFLGMVNYLSKFIPNLAIETKPLRELLSKDSVWVWDKNSSQTFAKVKKAIADASNLQYFDPSQPVTLSVDCSQKGVGATLLQPKGPIAYASQVLTSAQQNYCQIEKEMYAIVFGCLKFHHFIYGRPITVESDHRPLEYLFKKPMYKAPARIQRLMIRIQDYDLTVQYRPGKELFIADTLSRASIHSVLTEDTNLEADVEFHVHALYSGLPVAKDKLDMIAEATKVDQTLSQVKQLCVHGWPESKKACPADVALYWSYRDELTVHRDIVFKGSAIVIPLALRNDMMTQVHQGHVGMVRCKIRARNLLFWPGMNSDIEQMIGNCQTCLKFAHMPPAEPLSSEPVPLFPWQVVATDLFEFRKTNYLIVVDYYSKFFEVRSLPNLLSMTTIEYLKAIFATHGIPFKLVSDNAPQYSSEEFAKFTKDWGITHRTSSPTHPKGNGLVERTIQTVKNALQKCYEDGQDPYLALLNLRNMPVVLEYSPAQILMSRMLNSTLPVQTHALQPNVIPHDKIISELKRKQQYSAANHDQRARQRQPLTVGDQVMVKVFDIWKEGIIVEKVNEKSFWVKTTDGTYRRNKAKIRHVDTREFLDLSDITERVNDGNPDVTVPDSDNQDDGVVDVNNDNHDQTVVRRSSRRPKPIQRLDL